MDGDKEGGMILAHLVQPSEWTFNWSYFLYYFSIYILFQFINFDLSIILLAFDNLFKYLIIYYIDYLLKVIY